MNEAQSSAIALLADVYGQREAEKLIGGVRDMVKSQPDIMRMIASFAHVGTTVSSADLERTEGRREVFWLLMQLAESDPSRVAQFLYGENLE